MWRNGRRNGLKIRLSENSVWVRVPPSAASEMRLYDGGERHLKGYFVDNHDPGSKHPEFYRWF
jgi:hypothetical protein